MNWIGQFLKRRRITHDLSEEMQQHLEEKIETLIAGGMARAEAIHAARRAFGNATLLGERSREVWMWPLVENLWADVKYALRQLRKSPGFAVTAILTLALGIGATTAIFSLFQQVWLHALPVRDPGRLVLLRATGPQPPGYMSNYGDDTYYFSVPMFRDLRQQSGKVFYNMAAIGPFSSPMRAGAATQTVEGNFVTGSFFPTLGLRPVIGRLITPADDIEHAGNPVVVLSYDEWQQSFGGSPAALNQVVDINAHPFTIIGVAAAGFIGINRQQPAQIFVPMSMEPAVPTHDRSFLDMHDAIWINIVARLQPGMSSRRAEAQLNPLWLSLRKNELPLLSNHSQRFAQKYLRTHLYAAKGAEGLPFLERRVGPQTQVLMAMALLVLLIACVNLANLLLVRGAVRAKEIGVRAALGASRLRLMTWVLTEGMLLTVLGGLAGAGLGLLAMKPLASHLLGGASNPVSMSSLPGTHLLLFAAVAMLLTGLLSCLPSMILSTRPDLNQVLHESTIRNPRGASRLRPVFTSLQITLSFVLLVGACLLARTLYNLRNVDLGMRTDHIINFHTDVRGTGTNPNQTPAMMQRIADAIRSEPGISSVGYATVAIMIGDRSGSNITIAGHASQENDAMPPDRNIVNPDFFTTLGIPLVAGRVFRDFDSATAPKVAVVNEIFATHFFGSVSGALGRMFCFGPTKVPDITIVGVVQNSRSTYPDSKPVETLYIPFAQSIVHGSRQYAEFYVHTALAPHLVFKEIRHAVQGVNPSLPLDNFGTLEEQVSGDISTQRLLAGLSIGFGLLAALLAAIGLYGVLAYSTARRTREIGIRMALGADRSDVMRLVLRQVIWMTCAAMVLGVPLGLLLTRYLREQLFQVAYNDPWSFVATGLFLSMVIAVAAYGPVRRAAYIDPMQAIRVE